jgi:RNA polymerase sigma-70 factor (ECF subfamily)
MNNIEVNLLPSRGALLGYIRRKVSDPDLAEDILQESLLKALRTSDELRDNEKFVGWFYRIINNAIIDVYRRRHVQQRYLEELVYEQEASVQPDEHQAICACIRDVLPTLKPEYADLIEALELGTDEPENVADRLGITRNNLKVRRHRARTQLRERLEETCRSCATHGCLDCSCKRH